MFVKIVCTVFVFEWCCVYCCVLCVCDVWCLCVCMWFVYGLCFCGACVFVVYVM